MLKLFLGEVKDLYYDKKLSVPQISKKLGVTMRVVYRFMDSNNLPRRTVNEHNKILFQRKPLSYSVKRNLSDRERHLKVAGLMLYWAEGTSRGRHTVDLANSNPEMIQLFVHFLRQVYKIDERRLRVYLYCYSNQDINKLISYWSRLTRIPKLQFTKPFIRTDYSMKWGREMKHGLIHIRYSDKRLLELIRRDIKKYVEKNV